MKRFLRFALVTLAVIATGLFLEAAPMLDKNLPHLPSNAGSLLAQLEAVMRHLSRELATLANDAEARKAAEPVSPKSPQHIGMETMLREKVRELLIKFTGTDIIGKEEKDVRRVERSAEEGAPPDERP